MALGDDCDVLHVLTEMNQVTADTQPIANRESVKQLISYLDRIHSVLESLCHIPHTDLAPAIRTALQGIRSSLDSLQSISTKYKSKSGLYLILHGRKLNQELEEITHKIGQWLALLPLAEVPEIREVKKKIEDLIREMQHAVYKVPESEQYVCTGLEKLSEQTENSAMDKEVVNTIFTEVANLLGVDCEQDHGAMRREIALLKKDLQDCNEIENKHLMEALQKTFESWTLAPTPTSISDIEEDELTPYFDSFNCPLTKQVMKDPVVLQSRITYERSAIEEWFRTCREQMRELSCPVTHQTLTSADLLPNLVLRQTIDEWSERNATTRIRQAKQKLKSQISLDDIDQAGRALDDILHILDESSMNKYKLKDADLIPMILELCHLKGAAELRSKALIVLHRMAIDDADNQDRMIEAGVLRPVVKSLGSSIEKECENAVKLLLELSKQQEIAAKIGRFKGALITLAALTSRENLKVSVMAEETLQKLEYVRSNVILMADAGRLQPLLRLLSEGTEEDQIEAATFLAKTLTTSQKEDVAKYGVHTLVNMLSSGSQTGKEAALGALRNLSELKDNVPVLIKAEVLPPLMNILFDLSFTRISRESRTAAAKMFVHLVSVPGSWENAPVDPEGNTLESECVIHKLLGLLTHVTNDSKGELLQALSSIVSSPQASELVCGHVKTGNGIPTIISFLQGTEVAYRLSALNVISNLSEFIGTEMADELRCANLLHKIKDILKGKNTEERTAAACILSNLPLLDADVVSILEPELIRWIMDTISDGKSGRLTKSFPRPKLLVGLLGVLLHFACSSNDNIMEIMQRCDLMSLFVEQLTLQDEPLVKQKAAAGLQNLSEKAHHFTRDNQRNPTKSSILSIFCCSTSKAPQVCPVHSGFCHSNSFCLVTSKAVGPLLEVLQDKNYDVQLAAVSALSTLLSDSVNLKGGVEVLVRHEGIQHIFDLFFSQKPCDLQEKTVWMVERILRIEEYAQRHSVDQGLVKALVEAFKHGSPKTKQLAQQALTHMKELSGISAGRRKTRQVQ